MTQQELDTIIEQHQHWLNADCEGWEDMKADLYGADLSGAEKFRLGQILKEPIVGFKKTAEGVVITAEIPAGAVVFCINGSKCRTNKAKITNMAGNEVLHSQHDSTSSRIARKLRNTRRA